uniref:Uncharacterized protein n=1 Tax=Zooxanthella nutricula TaxID=1333877 RepID=A0A7S2P163_9DINO|eukprot:CAMPEP_0198547070 /NCGR_PEP_ID=MMETSP1462-20131121/67347_1 /TAXON_ID=1333877 /ORGANISM="Brandtodinium nutriculum, Strain RCC3387" /LENGTH=807 /DNA_ID=CAMNT_0044277541 /DNA_START=60 /DNA_END=2483 /DNA_ORIENTATION=-
MGCGNSSSKYDEKPNAGDGGKQDAVKQQKNDRSQAASENNEYTARMEFLGKVPLFKRLPQDNMPLLASKCTMCKFTPGQEIIKQGDEGEEFFVIRSGEAKVLISEDGDEKHVATLKAGDYFGEQSLVRNETRTATIQAQSALAAFKITQTDFRDLGLHEKLLFTNRRAVGVAKGKEGVESKAPDPKTAEDYDFIKKAIRSNANLTSIVKLEDGIIKALADEMWKESVPAGKEIITEGDLEADYFYVVQEGQFTIFQSEEGEDNQGQDAVKSKPICTMGPGGSFGELALLYFVPRAATVKADTASVVWVGTRDVFKKNLMKVTAAKVAEYVRYLDGVAVLTPLLAEEKTHLAKALVEMHFTKGEIVLQQGEPGSTFFILYDGTVKIFKDGVEVKTLEASVARGTAQYFGEGALLTNESRAATVQVTSESAKTLVLDRDSFNALLGPLQDIIEKSSKAKANGEVRKSFAGAGPGRAAPPIIEDEKKREKILRKDLSRIGLLGCGGFGTVELYEHRSTKDTYAMKGLSKGYIVKTNMQESVMNEKNILMMTNSDFVIKLYETYNGSQTLYFLLEPALGGELYATYNRKAFHGSEKHAKYYIAGTIFAFEHLHERRIIYRDLKPENLLLTHRGHIKLTDMGLAKFVIGKTYTTCGTPDYFAPELITSMGHTNAVDWWTLGILTFELMSGHPPFESAYPMQIYAKVTKGIAKIPFPPKCQGNVGDLIRSLLKAEPSERLPMRPGGAQNLKSHKWFDNFDWVKMKALQLDPPFSPVVKSKKDLANFSARKEDMPKALEYNDPGTGWDKGFATA